MLTTGFLYDNIPCGYLSFYNDGTIISINQTLLTWLGLEKDEVLFKKKFNNLLSIGGRLYYQMVIMPLLMREGSVNEINFDVLDKNGSFPVLCNAVTAKSGENGHEIINAILIKITDRKKLESELMAAKKEAEEGKRQFETLCHMIPNIIWTALQDGTVNFVNERFYKEFRLRAENLRLLPLLRLFHPAGRNKIVRSWKKSLTFKTTFEAEIQIRTGEGEYCWYLIRSVPYKDMNGRLTLWFGSCTNINDQKEKQLKKLDKLNDSLTEASQIIKKQDQKLEEISYSQSHLVRRPLANILGLIQIMENENLDDIQKIYSPMLKQSAEELDRMINAIVIKT